MTKGGECRDRGSPKAQPPGERQQEMLFDRSRARGRGASASAEIAARATAEDKRAMTAAPWDPGRAEGNGPWTLRPCVGINLATRPFPSQSPGPKGQVRPSGCSAWAGGSRPHCAAQGPSCWPGCRGERQSKSSLHPCLQAPPLPSSGWGEKCPKYWWEAPRGAGR